VPAGLGSSVSCLFPLYRNRDALLSGLTHGSVGCMRGSMASGSTHLAAAYLWDLRRPKKPASSLNFPVEPPAAASPAAAAAADCAGTAEAASVTSSPLTSRAVAASCAGEVGPAAGVPGILCLSVHEDGALAAGGFKDGRVLTWDMRQVRILSSTGHVCFWCMNWKVGHACCQLALQRAVVHPCNPFMVCRLHMACRALLAVFAPLAAWHTVVRV